MVVSYVTGTAWHLSNCWDSFSSLLMGREQKCLEGQGFPEGRRVGLGLSNVAGRVSCSPLKQPRFAWSLKKKKKMD